MSAAPQATRPEQQYVQFLQEGKFMLQRSRSNGGYVFYPRVAQPRTGDTDLEWVEASGDGVVYATTTMRQRAPQDNYNVALIDLAEGVRMMSRVVGIAPENVRIGMRVRARVARENETAMVVFELAPSASN
jgi:uncharacterized OB-fold protein